MTLKIAFPTLIAFLFLRLYANPGTSSRKKRCSAPLPSAVPQRQRSHLIWLFGNWPPAPTIRICLRPKRKATNKYRQILKAARNFKIAAKDIQTGQLNINKEYEYRKYGDRGGFKHYSIRRNVTLIQRNIETFDALLTRIGSKHQLRSQLFVSPLRR